MTLKQPAENPKEQGPKPPFPKQRQQPPGLEQEMQPRPDYGESSYRGSGRLKGKAAMKRISSENSSHAGVGPHSSARSRS